MEKWRNGVERREKKKGVVFRKARKEVRELCGKARKEERKRC